MSPLAIIVLFVAVGWILAQGAAFLPTDLAGCKLWLRRDVGLWKDLSGTIPATANGDHVARWDDQSGSGNHLIQTLDSGQRPVLVTSALNGHSVPGFDGAGQSMAVASGGPTAAHSIFVYGRLTGTPGGFVGLACVSAVGATGQNSALGATATPKLFVGGFGRTGAGLIGGTLVVNTWYTLGKKWDGTSSSGYINGTLSCGPTADALTLSASMGIGLLSTGSFCPCQLLSVIVYNSAMSDSDRNSVETFQANEASAVASLPFCVNEGEGMSAGFYEG